MRAQRIADRKLAATETTTVNATSQGLARLSLAHRAAGSTYQMTSASSTGTSKRRGLRQAQATILIQSLDFTSMASSHTLPELLEPRSGSFVLITIPLGLVFIIAALAIVPAISGRVRY